jgi:hypothetical protein
VAVVALLLVPVCSQAQTPLGSQTLSLTLQNAVKISVPSSAALTHSGTAFADYTANGVSISYWIRTSSGGSGNIQVQATSDFSCVAGGPCIATPPTAGDALTYTCSGATLGTNCSGSQTVSTTAQTNAVTGIGGGACTGGGGACSSAIPNTGTLNLTLTNDPKYPTGSYSAVLTFTISAT